MRTSRTLLLPLALLALAACTRKAGEPCTATSQCNKGLTCCGTCTDLKTDLAHCGDCAVACGTQNGGAICQGGSCRFACQTGFADCNAVPNDGCETNLSATASACGTCTTSCSYSNAEGVCSASHCALGACRPGFADCDRQSGNGCEVNTNTSAQHCGACGTVCSVPNATPRCEAAKCVVGTCDTGFGDCDVVKPGCESDLNRSSAHCGNCTTACDGGMSCVQGECKAQDLLLYGGFPDTNGTTPVASAWRFDITDKTFTRVTTASGAAPPARGYHSAAWDGAGNRMLVFGGSNGTVAVPNDVWALDFTADPPTWRQLTTTGTRPSARLGAASGWDPVGRKLYVFGGVDDMSSSTALGDCFVFDAAALSWTAVTATGPLPRFLAAGTWDPASQRFILFGGAPDQSSVLDDTWAYDPSAGTWQQLLATGPGGRMAGGFFPGPPLLFGGMDFSVGVTLYDDLYLLTAAMSPPTWHDEGSTGGPPGRGMAALATLGGTNYVFGGFAFDPVTFDPLDFDDLWSYAPATKTWTELRQSGAAGAPGISQGATLVGRQ